MIYSQHRLIQPLVIQPISLIQPFPLDTLHWLPMYNATLWPPTEFDFLTSCRIRQEKKIFARFLMELTGADCTYINLDVLQE